MLDANPLLTVVLEVLYSYIYFKLYSSPRLAFALIALSSPSKGGRASYIFIGVHICDLYFFYCVHEFSFVTLFGENPRLNLRNIKLNLKSVFEILWRVLDLRKENVPYDAILKNDSEVYCGP